MDVITPEQAKIAEALRRIGEGAAMIRAKGEFGTGNVIEAVSHIRLILREIRQLAGLAAEEVGGFAKNIAAPPRNGPGDTGIGVAAGSQFCRWRNRHPG